MNGWQNVATLVILIISAGYVVVRFVRFIRRKGMPDCRCCPHIHKPRGGSRGIPEGKR
jgi:hypothetical protein